MDEKLQAEFQKSLDKLTAEFREVVKQLQFIAKNMEDVLAHPQMISVTPIQNPGDAWTPHITCGTGTYAGPRIMTDAERPKVQKNPAAPFVSCGDEGGNVDD